MKKDKLLVIIFAVLGSIFIILGFIGIVLFQENGMKTEEEKKLLELYQKIEEQVEVFSKKRQDMYNKVLNNIYLNEIPIKKADWDKELKAYEQELGKTVTMIEDNKSVCEIDYQKEEYQNKCDAITIKHEQVINSYVKDTKTYNDILEGYNKLPSISEENKQELYNVIYQDYVDFNQDGKYEGKDQ